MPAPLSAELDAILADVSRSFYLSLSVLPRAIRPQLSITYLVARAADTLADTTVLPGADCLRLLALLRAAIHDGEKRSELSTELLAALASPRLAEDEEGAGTPAERRLLGRIDDCLSLLAREPPDDLARAREVLDALITGMERDLQRFPDATLRALKTRAELDEHTYLAAGCVGEYWTRTTAARFRSLAHLAGADGIRRGVHLGKALQLINIVRDAPSDLAAGRCYFPLDLLGEHALSPADLVGSPESRRAARPAVEEFFALAFEQLDAAWPYVMSIPRSAPRLRLACIWPLWIGLATLRLLVGSDDPLAPGAPLRVSRAQVYRIVASSTAVVGIDPMLARAHWSRRAEARKPGARHH